MGTPMAVNLTNAGHEVVGFDPVAAIPAGVTKAQTAQDAASGADVVITMLPNGAIARRAAMHGFLSHDIKQWTSCCKGAI